MVLDPTAAISTADVMLVPTVEFLRLYAVWIVGALVIISAMTFIDLWNHRGERD